MTRKLLITIALLIVSSTCLQAQISMTLKSDRDNYLKYENVNLQLGLTNNTGVQLKFDEFNNGKVTVNVTTLRGKVILPYSKHLNLANGLVLPPGQTKQLIIPVNKYYNLKNNDTYYVKIIIQHPRLSAVFAPKQIILNVHQGDELDVIRFGAVGKDGKIANRSCELFTFTSKRKRHLGLRIKDDKYVYAVHRLAQISGSVTPKVLVDARSHLHLLFKVKPRTYFYWLFGPKGVVKQSATYLSTDENIPRLIKDPDIGRVVVSGGRLHLPGEEEHFELPEFHK